METRAENFMASHRKRQFYILEKFVLSFNRAQRHLHSQDLVKCAGDREIILCCTGF